DRPVFTLEWPSPQYAERLQLWRTELQRLPNDLDEEQLKALAGKFRLSGGQIHLVVATARDLAAMRKDGAAGAATGTVDDLYQASGWHSSQRLGLRAQTGEPRYTLSDIVLPPDQKALLNEICGQFRHMPLVYEQWGFLGKP